MGTQKNHLNERVLWTPKTYVKTVVSKKVLTINNFMLKSFVYVIMPKPVKFASLSMAKFVQANNVDEPCMDSLIGAKKFLFILCHVRLL